MQNQRLSGKVAIITGGTSGIGLATAELFAAEGARVVITGRNPDKALAALKSMSHEALFLNDVHFIAADVRQPDDCQRVVNETLAEFAKIDILFNNAGIVPWGTVLETPLEVWNDVFATNVTGTYLMCRAALPQMIARGSGVIVNNGSDWGVVGGQGAAAYSASKGAIALLTKSLALDHGRQGIRVNAICPGDTYVARWREKRAEMSDEAFADYLAGLGDGFPMGRVGRVEEIARAVLFLASDDSSYMTGQLLVVDGGNTAGGTSASYPNNED
jgi:meso-butanediol dehydrogenase / (S,S)-butanediol dehydrogenase / diacetyl reductase